MRGLAAGLVVALVAVGCSAQGSIGSQPAPAYMSAAGEQQGFVWVCHGGRNPKWHRVSVNAASAHRRHGDRVSNEPQGNGQRCR